MPSRLKTHVDNLDAIMEGGVPEGNVVIIFGKPGSMKSSLAYSILHNNMELEGKKALYVCLEQSSASLISNMEGLGFKPPTGHSDMNILDIGILRKYMPQIGYQAWIELFRVDIQNLKKNFNFEVLAIDSLPVLEMLAKFKEPREELFYFFEWLRELKCTTFIVHEEADNPFEYGEDYLADGVIHLDLRRDEKNVNLYLGIAKMRKTVHRRGYFPLIFDHGKFELVID
ncbi:MAG: RAD55 family ATPase [Thermoplasmata archaeon]|nr:RAD55 family ATPase [Thermoplasmata archaeon]